MAEETDFFVIEPDEFRFIFSRPEPVAPEPEPQAGENAGCAGCSKRGCA